MSRETEINALIDWMSDGAPPSADGRQIVTQICNKLNHAGIPIDLYRLFLLTIHPLVGGRRLQWTDEDGTQIAEAGFALFDSDQYHANPMPDVIRTRKSLRRRLVDPECPRDYRIVEELIEEGFTDYLIQPVIYIDGEVHAMSWATQHPEGFSDFAINSLERIRAPLTRLVESYILRLNAASIISTYVGRNAGEQVLSGHIKRGDTEEISAVILFADLKSYTSLSNRMPAAQVIDTLNRYYDALAVPINSHRGEISKFMGDGLLAIFPLKDNNETELIEHARDARKAVRQAHAEFSDGDGGFRTALHIGRLFYGNIGAANRLDFTAIGPSVNLAARLLDAAEKLGADDVCSQSIAELLPDQTKLLGSLNLKGFDMEQQVYRLE
ncbi:MAG: adenylate/guanylate cyclase domain-containing protein [Rhizobiaceae bacterium]